MVLGIERPCMAEMDGVSDVTCCFQEINDPFVNVFDSFFGLFSLVDREGQSAQF